MTSERKKTISTTQKKTKVIITRLCTGKPGIKLFPLIDIKIANFLISGYGDGYDEEDDDQYEMDSLEDATTTEDGTKDDNNIYKDMTRTRFVEPKNEAPTQEITFVIFSKARSITGITDQGVPILEEPYVPNKNRTKTAAENFVPNFLPLHRKDEKNPKLKLTWDSNRRIINGARR